MMTATNKTDAQGVSNRQRISLFVERIAKSTSARIGQCCRREDGSTVAEMALVMPILLVVLTGVFSFGVALNQYLVLTNAVNNGARAFAMSAPSEDGNTSIAPSSDPCKYAQTAIQNAATTLTSSNLSYTITYTTYKGNPSGTGTSSTLANATASPSCSTLAMYQQDVVQIQVTYPITPVLYGWASKQLSLSATSTEMVQ